MKITEHNINVFVTFGWCLNLLFFFYRFVQLYSNIIYNIVSDTGWYWPNPYQNLTQKKKNMALCHKRKGDFWNSIELKSYTVLKAFFNVFILLVSDVLLVSYIRRTSPDWVKFRTYPGLWAYRERLTTKVCKQKRRGFKMF